LACASLGLNPQPCKNEKITRRKEGGRKRGREEGREVVVTVSNPIKR